MADQSERVLYVEDKVTNKWVLVCLDADGEVVKDPRDYEDVHVPPPNQQTRGRVWVNKNGKWVNELVEASKEELAQARAAIRRASGGLPKNPRMLSSLPSSSYDISEEGGGDTSNRTADSDLTPNMGGDDAVVKYHIVKPSDTFQFICLKYRVSADALRGANNFSGSTLKNAPRKLVIPKASGNRDKQSSPKVVTMDVSSQGMKKKQEAELEALRVGFAGVCDDGPRFSVSSTRLKKPAPMTSSRQDEDEVQYHWVQPDDSLRWICLKYKVNANDIRRANGFTGSNLQLAPKKLIIPKKTRMPKRTPRPRRPRADNISIASYGKDDDSVASTFFSVTSLSEFTHWEASPDATSTDVSSEYAGSTAPPTMVHLQGRSKFGSQMSDSEQDTSDEEELGESMLSLQSSGVRYHDVRPTDTVEYICMKYRVSASALRRANIGLTGRNLQVGPKRLIIPPRDPSTIQSNNSFCTKQTEDTWETETVTTMHDDTNSIALSDCHSVVSHSTFADTLFSVDSFNISSNSFYNDNYDADEEEAIYHEVQPRDTLQGICLQYGVAAYELRRANNFRGTNLKAAPERLVIPQNGNLRNKKKKDFKSMTEDEKVQSLMAHIPSSKRTKKPLLSYDEVRAYLEFNDWNFFQALRNIKVDTDDR